MGTTFLAANNLEIAKECLDKLVKRFPDSNRVKRAGGMILEFSKQYDEALALYDEILKKSPSNFQAMKRKVCVHKAKGDIRAAIAELNGLLKLNVGDIGAWLELSEFYISICDYDVVSTIC